MNEQSLEYYIDNYIQGTITDEEWKALQELLKESANNEYLKVIMEDQLNRSVLSGMEYPQVVNRVKAAVELKIEEENKRKTNIVTTHRIHLLKTAWFRYPTSLKLRWAKYAAAIVIMFGIGAYLWNQQYSSKSTSSSSVLKERNKTYDILPGSNKAMLTLSNGQQIQLDNASSETIQDGAFSIKNNNGRLSYTNVEIAATNTMTTPKGGQYKLTLSDGTNVWLNAVSSITYPTAFKGQTREVSITGEVYFEVARNASKPFKVHVTPSTAGGGEEVDSK